jgi:hypothetical protein
VADRVCHDKKAGDEIDADYQRPYQRHFVGLLTVGLGFFTERLSPNTP